MNLKLIYLFNLALFISCKQDKGDLNSSNRISEFPLESNVKKKTRPVPNSVETDTFSYENTNKSFELFNLGLTIHLPKYFKRMPSNTILLKFPSVDLNKIDCFSRFDDEVGIIFRLHTMRDSISVEDFFSKIERDILGQQSVRIINKGTFESAIGTIPILEFWSAAFDTEIYNQIFMVKHKRHIIIGNYNCTQKYYPIWGDLGWQILASIK